MHKRYSMKLLDMTKINNSIYIFETKCILKKKELVMTT